MAALSELRNDLVHDVRNAEFRLGDWFASLDPAKQKALAVSFSPFETFLREGPHLPGAPLNPSMLEQAKIENVMKRAKEQAKTHIWIGGRYVLVNILDMKGYSDYRQWAKAKALMRDDEDDAG